LPEEVAGPQGRHACPVALDRNLAADQHHQVAAGISLADEHLAGRHVDLLGELADSRDLVLVQAGEERDPMQQVELLVAGHGRLASLWCPARAYANGPSLRRAASPCEPAPRAE